MALGVTELIRGASGILFVLLGLATAALAARGVAHQARAWWLAAYCVAFGASFIPFNFFPLDDVATARTVVAANLAGWVFAGLALAGLATTMPRPTRRDLVLALSVSVAFLAAWLDLMRRETVVREGFASIHPVAVDLYSVSLACQRVVSALAIGLAFLLARRAARERDVGAAWLAVALVPYSSVLLGEYAGAFALALGREAWFALMATACIVVSFAWIWAAPVTGRVALAAAISIPAGILAGQVENEIAGEQTGLVGVVRIAMGVALANAIIRHDLLGAGLAARTAQRSSATIVALASLFVVAQVTLPFLPGAVGLALGGVVATGLTLAGPMIQRSLAAPEANATPTDAKLATYRDAVRYALRDGTMSRKEEMHLATLAQHLGIGAADAVRARHEVEDERSARP